MDKILGCIVFVLILIGAAVAHEADLSRNFAETGDAKAFFFDIKCDHK